MSNYVEYEYYSDTFHGTLAQTEFVKHRLVAQSQVDRATDFSIDTAILTEAQLTRLKNCVCELIDTIDESYEHAGISSERIGDMSVTYSDVSSYYAKKTADIIDRWLGDLFVRKYGWV